MSIPEVEVDEAARMVEEGAWLLDVREPAEWDAGHSPLAAWIPLGELGTRLDEVPTDRTVAIICRSGGRSAAATEALRSTGVDAVNVAGGMKAWAGEGLDVVASDGLPGVVT
jgi:rhodanese-related sulfurtransferase